jgi:hypothetical protein
MDSFGLTTINPGKIRNVSTISRAPSQKTSLINENTTAALNSKPSTRKRYPDDALKILSSFMIYDIIMISQRYYNKSYESRKTEK